jgi:hypothetical protein
MYAKSQESAPYALVGSSSQGQNPCLPVNGAVTGRMDENTVPSIADDGGRHHAQGGLQTQ